MNHVQPIASLETQTAAFETDEAQNFNDQQLQIAQDHGIQVTEGWVQTAGARVEFALLRNPNATGTTPVGIANGLCAPPGAYIPFANQLAARGHNVFWVRPPRVQDPRYAYHPEHLTNPLKLQAQAVWAVGKLAMWHFNSQDIDLYGHSMGGVVATDVAKHHPGVVDKLILSGSGGIDGKHNLLHRIRRLPVVGRYDIGEAIGDIYKQSGAKFGLEVAYHIGRRPDRTLLEAIAVACRDIRSDIDKVQASGTRVGLISFGRDGFFNHQDVLAANRGRKFDAFMHIPNVRHVYVQQDPLEHSYDAAHLLETLDTAKSLSVAS